MSAVTPIPSVLSPSNSASQRKLLIWTVIPTHHQSHFFAAIRAANVDLVVHYFGAMAKARVLLGWKAPPLAEGERRVPPNLSSLKLCADWQERVHIVPGYNKPFLLRLARLLSARAIPWFHWSEPSGRSRHSWLTYPIKRYYGYLVDRHAVGALAIGDMAARSFMTWGVRASRIRFLPYAIAAPHINTRSEPVPDSGAVSTLRTPRFLFLGALCHRKACDVLLRAFYRVVSQFPDARLDLVGHDHSNGGYQRLAVELGIAKQMRILPSVPADEIGEVIAAHDVLVLPSRFDGWGMVLNEAAALGRPIISTEKCGAAHHLLLPGRNGFRIPAEDAPALAEAMLEYCRAPHLIHAHGKVSKEVFLEFTPERNAQRLIEALSTQLPT